MTTIVRRYDKIGEPLNPERKAPGNLGLLKTGDDRYVLIQHGRDSFLDAWVDDERSIDVPIFDRISDELSLEDALERFKRVVG